MNWGELSTSPDSPGPFRTAVKDKIPEIKAASRVTESEELLLSFKNKNLKSPGIYVDDDFLQMFSFPTIAGDAVTALTTPDAIVLTKRLAEKLFGNKDPIGQTVELDEGQPFKVTAVVEDVPKNSEIQFEWLGPWQAYEEEREWAKTWGNITFKTYVQLVEDIDLETANKKIAFIGEAKELDLEFFLQPFKDTYLFGEYTAGKQTGGRIEYVRIFSGIALFLLIIACINFMNLSTARSSQRAKEIGVRKVVGASRSLLRQQFLGEAILLSVISMILGLVLLSSILDRFNTFFEKEISIDYGSPIFWLGASALILISGVLAGSYPAFLLSALKPVKVLKGELSRVGDRFSIMRKSLVVFQFIISGILILGSLTIQQQILFIKNKNLGIDRKDAFYVEAEGSLWEKTDLVKQKLSASSGIQHVTISGNDPFNVSGGSRDLQWPGKTPKEDVIVAGMGVGDDFLGTFGLELVEGRALSKDHPSDSTNYIVNESLVKAIGLEEPIGTEIDFWMGTGKIVGVVKDYHLNSLHVPIRPLVLFYSPNDWYVWIKPKNGKTEEAIAHAEKVFQELNPNYPFNYTFADTEFENLYRNETLTGNLANTFGVIAIIISCLGLLGLATYSAERRRKEISIRKVLGASIGNIIGLLSKDFIRLILIALVVALPIGWYLMQAWLKQFAYRIEIQWWTFALAGFTAIGVALFVVSVQSVRAAVSNPIDAIQQE